MRGIDLRVRLRTLMMLAAVGAAMLAAERWRRDWQHRKIQRSAKILQAALGTHHRSGGLRLLSKSPK